MYKRVIEALRQAYDKSVDERDQKCLEDWKATEHAQFLALMQQEGKSNLLEIGSGTGVHAKFFQDHGIQVIATDLSPKMVKRCREKGLEAYEMDFMNLDFQPCSFDAIFAMNCLLHVPQTDLSRVILRLHRLLMKGGLFYWGQYGGIEKVGIHSEDHYEPKRFYSFLTDDQILDLSEKCFSLVKFNVIPVDDEELHFQSLVLKKKREKTPI